MPILDQMNVKANESDTQGTDYDIRDRKLTTATSQSGVNTSDVVLLKDTSGNYHEITKDSFMGAVRSALGSLIKNYDKGTNVNGIAVTGSTGTVNDLGFSSPSDLASVLGVPRQGQVGTEDDLNDFMKNGVWTIYSSQNPAHNPFSSGNSSILIVYSGGGYKAQLAIPISSNTMAKTRTTFGNSNQWSDWYDITLNVPSFYKDYSTLAALSSAMGAVSPQDNTYKDMNLYVNSGIYHLTNYVSEMSNWPDGLGQYSILIVFKSSISYTLQLAADIGSSPMKVFLRTGNTQQQQWTTWRQISLI